jgi:hypothetical protein
VDTRIGALLASLVAGCGGVSVRSEGCPAGANCANGGASSGRAAVQGDSGAGGRAQSGAGDPSGRSGGNGQGAAGGTSANGGTSRGGATAQAGTLSGGGSPNTAGAPEDEGGTGEVPSGGVLSYEVLASDNGVAFVSAPGLAHLSEAVRVTDGRGAPVGWYARSDRDWLSVTTEGSGGEEVVLTADPAGLRADQVAYATVTLSPNADAPAGDRIRVGLWVASEEPPATAKVVEKAQWLVTDPIRPYAYVDDGGTDIRVYNVFTGKPQGTLPGIAAELGSLAVSSDGSRLFAADLAKSEVVPIDLDRLSSGSSWPLESADPTDLAYARTRGHGLVVTGTGRFYDADSGALLAPTFRGGASGIVAIDASLDGTRLCRIDRGSPYGMECYPLDFDVDSGGLDVGAAVTGDSTGDSGVGSNGQDIAVSVDGSLAVVASAAPYNFRAYDSSGAVVQMLGGDAYPNNVEVTDQGVIVAGASVAHGPADVWLYALDGAPLASHRMSGDGRNLRPRQLKASGDGMRIVALTEDPALAFVTAVP